MSNVRDASTRCALSRGPLTSSSLMRFSFALHLSFEFSTIPFTTLSGIQIDAMATRRDQRTHSARSSRLRRTIVSFMEVSRISPLLETLAVGSKPRFSFSSSLMTLKGVIVE